MHPKLSPSEEIQVHSLVLLALQARLLRLDSNFPGIIQLICPSSRFLNSHCRDIVKTTLKDLGFDPKEYGLYSLRSGGATAVISNNASKAVSERLFKLHGRWKTNEAKDVYVLETECNRLSVTKYLGI